MKTILGELVTGGVIAAALAFPVLTAADEDLPDAKLADWKIGETLRGDEVKADDLEGKVVVIEYWGTRWGACIAAMPHLVQMDKRYGKKGLKVIGDECQGSSAEDIEEVAKENRVAFSITKGSTRPPGMRGIPHAVVFDPSGAMVFSGHPTDDEFERSVKKALKDVGEIAEEKEDEPVAAGPMIEEREWTNSDGKTITAAIVRVEGDTVTFKMKGREISYSLAKLTEEDQEMIKEALEEKEDEE